MTYARKFTFGVDDVRLDAGMTVGVDVFPIIFRVTRMVEG